MAEFVNRKGESFTRDPRAAFCCGLLLGRRTGRTKVDYLRSMQGSGDASNRCTMAEHCFDGQLVARQAVIRQEEVGPMPEFIRLADIASARSGDKGNHVNIGVVAKSKEAFEYLLLELTSEVISEYFRNSGVSRVERFEMPNVWALNFVLYDALAGGASQSLRLDSQGKLFGTALMELPLPVAGVPRICSEMR